jgi:sulfide:quinone oxidoreductase
MGRPHVVVLGGGFAGLETVFNLRHRLGEKVNLSLVSDRGYFLFKPNLIYVPFGEDPERLKIYLDPPSRMKMIDFVEQEVREIDVRRNKVVLHDFDMPFDYLVIATGAAMHPVEIPGLAENAITVWTPGEMLRLREAYQKLCQKAQQGQRQQLLFLIPPHNGYAGPLYEMAMMTETWLREKGMREGVDITYTTAEDQYLQAFGSRSHEVVAEEFRERGITGLTGHVVDHVVPGSVIYRNGEKLDYDLLVSFPPHIAARTYLTLPHDDRGFIRVQPETRRVRGYERIFAAGDNATFPIKQAFLALLQADCVADHIAADILHEDPRVLFEPISMYVMEQLNKATFAQTRFTYSGDPVTPDSNGDGADCYKVGVSPMWRVGKKIMGAYLPWRFGHGEPFHTGITWEALDLGLKVAAKVMAT